MATSAQIVDVLFVALVIGMVLFWIFVVPLRARKLRRAEQGSSDGRYSKAWDRTLDTRRRDS
jgi:hypothetical protein